MSTRQLSGEFRYSFEIGFEFGDDDLIPREISNFKKTVCHHISGSNSHAGALKDRDEKKKHAEELKSKNCQAGLNLGRLCMNYLLGRPFTDCKSDVLVLKKSGAVVGELNPSRKFPAAFKETVCKVLNKRGRRFLQKQLQ